MAGVQFDPTDEPVFNGFDLPTMCTGVDNAERSCCDPCQEWLFCLSRSPIEMHLPGFDISRWLPCVAMSASKVIHASGVLSGGGETDVFHGVYLALTANERLTHGNCGSRGLTTRCQDLLFDDGFGDYSEGLTHTTTQGRTVYAADGYFSRVKNMYVDLNVECEEDETLGTCLRFKVILYWEFERSSTVFASCVGALIPGMKACDPGVVAAIDALEFGWLNPEGYDPPGTDWESIGVNCCEIMRSALVPLTGLTWADLANVELVASDPGVAGVEWELDDPLEPDGPWVPVPGPDQDRCDGRLYGKFKTVPWALDTIFDIDCTEDEFEDCGGNLAMPVPISGEHGDFNDGCPHPDHADAEVWAYGYEGNGIWIPPPITVNEGEAFLKVLATGCVPPENCATCKPDPEGSPNASVPAAFWVTVSEGPACGKIFTPHATDCVNIVKVYWSWGDVTDGLDVARHLIVNLDPDGEGLQLKETITAIAIDDRGCIYCDTVIATCGCCEGVGGDLDVVVGTDNCGVEVTASTSGECEGGGPPFIEVQFYTGANPAGHECWCDEEEETDEDCLSDTIGLADGQSASRPGVFKGLRWRVWDQLCGCAGPWVEVLADAFCPTIIGLPVLGTEVTDVIEDIEPGCGNFIFIETFTWQFTWKAYYCGERVSFLWSHSGYGEGCTEGTITNPGDPIEDQIAEATIIETGIVRERFDHAFKYWLAGESFLCEGGCVYFPECSAINTESSEEIECDAIGLPACYTP